MKIKILTFHSELNFGANLQAYALKEFLTLEGHEVSFIDFERHDKTNFLLSFIRKWVGKTPSSTFLKIKNNISGPSSLKAQYDKKKVFNTYQKKYLQHTKIKYTSLNQLKNLPPVGDVYIVGSDQVWSPKIVSDLDFPIYFLDFGSKDVRKISYAASSGGEVFSKELEQLGQDLISKFNFVGIRESSLVSYLSGIGIKKAQWTPDPTFLVDWIQHLEYNGEEKQNRIAQFTLAERNLEKSQLLESKLCDLELFSNVAKFDLSSKNVSPFHWILEIAKSRLLITDSYHAVLFSIFSKTPFLFIKWGENHKRDERVLNLLELFELEYLAIDQAILKPETENLLNNFDWDKIEKKVNEFRIIGEDFLKNSLS